MLDLKPIKKITVTEQIMEQIAQHITSGQIKPGEKLPNERDLAEQFHVTRGRIREALRALSLVGLITIKAGEGSFVNHTEVPIPSDTIVWMYHNEIDNVEEIYAARKLIESEVYMTAAKNATAEDKSNLETLMKEIAQVPKTESEHMQDLIDRYDLMLGDISRNRIYAKLMQTIVYLRRETSIRLLQLPGAWENSLKYRTMFVQALIAGDHAKIRDGVAQFHKSAKKFYDISG